jgi:hypothetical protein
LDRPTNKKKSAETVVVWAETLLAVLYGVSKLRNVVWYRRWRFSGVLYPFWHFDAFQVLVWHPWGRFLQHKFKPKGASTFGPEALNLVMCSKAIETNFVGIPHSDLQLWWLRKPLTAV